MMSHALERAIGYWRNDKEIPMDLAAALMREGYDIPALEARYRV